MNSKTVIVLILAAAAAGGVAVMMDRGNHASPSANAPAPGLLLPELKDKVNDVASIVVKRPGTEFTISRTGSVWGVADRGGYPAQVEQVKTAVVGLSQLRTLETKTSNPSLYAKIGVQDPPDKADPTPAPTSPDETPPTQPTLVTLKNDKGETLASVIVGTQKWGNPPSVFVRKAGDKQSWLAEGRLEVPTDVMSWVERQVVNIPRDRVKSVVITRATGEKLEASREKSTDASFTIKDIPQGRELTAPTSAEQAVAGIQYVSIDDVSPADKVTFGDAAKGAVATAVYTTFDGLVITVDSTKQDNKDWIRIAAKFDEAAVTPPPSAEPEKKDPAPPPTPPKSPQKTPDEVKKEADELNAKLSKWAFAVADYKAKSFALKIDDLLKPLTTTPPANPAEEPGPLAPPAGPAPVLPGGG